MNDVSNIDELIEEIVTLPALPVSVDRVLQLVNDPKCSLAEVGKAISADPSLALKTLRLVNSAFYGLRTQIVSVDHAVTLLGIKVIKNLALTATVFDTFKGGADQLLRHSITCGVAMRALLEIGDSARRVEPDEAFVYGLLHDVGKIVFEAFLHDEYQASVKLSQEKGIPTFDAEREIIGADHSEMGERLAQTWKLPPPLVSAIAGHHSLGRCSDPSAQVLAALLAVADYMCHASGIPSHPDCTVVVPAEMWKASNLTREQMPAIMDKFFASLPSVDELMALAS